MSVAAGLLLIFWASVVAAGLTELRNRPRCRPLLTQAVCAVAALFLVVQFLYPPLLDDFERDAKILHDQWWRLVTALFFQDGWPEV